MACPSGSSLAAVNQQAMAMNPKAIRIIKVRLALIWRKSRPRTSTAGRAISGRENRNRYIRTVTSGTPSPMSFTIIPVATPKRTTMRVRMIPMKDLGSVT